MASKFLWPMEPPVWTNLFLTWKIQGKNVDPGFRMRVRMTQLPRLLFPASAEFRNFAFKIQVYWPESCQLEATEWKCYLTTTLLCFTSMLSWWILTILSRSSKNLFITISFLCLLYFVCGARQKNQLLLKVKIDVAAVSSCKTKCTRCNV